MDAGWVDLWMDEWVVGWMSGWIGEWVDGQIDADRQGRRVCGWMGESAACGPCTQWCMSHHEKE